MNMKYFYEYTAHNALYNCFIQNIILLSLVCVG